MTSQCRDYRAACEQEKWGVPGAGSVMAELTNGAVAIYLNQY
jgi:hypothetical protein